MARLLRSLLWALNHLYAATFAAATGVNLRLDDSHSFAKLLGCGLGLRRSGNDHSSRHGYPETSEDFLCLKLVDVHRFRTAKSETLRLDYA